MIRHAGSPAIALGLAASLGAWYLILAAAGSTLPGWQALDLISFRLFGALLLISFSAGAADALTKGRRLRFCFSLAALFLLLATTYCYLFRFEGALSLAEGEDYEPFPTTFSSGQKGLLAPFPELAFTLTRVEPDGKGGRAVIVQRGVGTEVGTRWQRIGSSEIRFVRSALAPLVVVTGEGKGELERSYVKVDVTGGKEASFVFDTLPYEFFLRKEKPQGSEKELFRLNVRRGKLGLYDGPVQPGQKVPVQSVEVSIEDQRKFAMLEIRTRRGLPVLQAAAVLLALVSLAVAAAIFKGDSLG